MDLYRWLLRKHITPHLGGVPVGKLSTAMIREWRAELLGNGVSVSVAAKAYRLLRAVLMTAVEEDKILPRNPCRIRGAGDEDAPERPVLTVAQVFALAELVGRRPVGNIRKLPAGGYRLRFRRHGQLRTSPEVYGTRPDAERALWKMADDGRADCDHDRRYLALVLLATFASLRWGEVTALRRCDLDLEAGTVRVRAAFVERSTGEILLGPPKSRAGRRVVGIPAGDHPGPARAPDGLRQGRAGGTGLPRRPRAVRCDEATSTRCPPGPTPCGRSVPRPALSRSAAYGQHVRGVQRRGPAGSDGPDGSRQRASGA